MRSWSYQKEACLLCLGRIVGHSEVKTPVSEILNLRIARLPVIRLRSAIGSKQEFQFVTPGLTVYQGRREAGVVMTPTGPVPVSRCSP